MKSVTVEHKKDGLLEMFHGVVTEVTPESSWLHPYIGNKILFNKKYIVLYNEFYDNENYHKRGYIKPVKETEKPK